jgi:hypothetical protein
LGVPTAHDQPDADLLAVGAVVARVTTLRLIVAFALAFKIGAGHVVQQQVVLQIEQLAEAVLEVFFQTGLVRQQRVQGAVELVVVDLAGRHAQQVAQRRPVVQMLGDPQLAAGFDQPHHHQHQRHQRPGHVLAPGWDQFVQQRIKPQPLHQLHREPSPAKITRPLHPHPRRVHVHPARR